MKPASLSFQCTAFFKHHMEEGELDEDRATPDDESLWASQRQLAEADTVFARMKKRSAKPKQRKPIGHAGGALRFT